MPAISSIDIIIITLFIFFVALALLCTFFDNQKNLSGTVVDGNKIGGPIMDYPTANIEGEHGLKSGVYSCETQYGDAIIFATRHPEDGEYLEVHIKDFSGDIYGERLMMKKIRKVNSRITDIFDAGWKTLGYY